MDESRFFEIMEQLDAGTLKPEEAVRRIMAHYQFAVGVHLRALGELRPEMLGGIVSKLMKELNATAATYQTDAPDPLLAPEVPADGAEPVVLWGRKSDKGLMRDKLILIFLSGKNHPVALAEISEHLQKREANLDESSLIAHLDRLAKAHAISRPRKGHYTLAKGSRSYLKGANDEIEKRGISEDVLRGKGN